ncbi:hypothetical protein [Kocuria sp. CPCC 204721]|uniref:hypothetical protein n=1 Tax=Kocuria sp. CPCC 204721 TaxID=3073548 RepID=UPI0034D42461
MALTPEHKARISAAIKTKYADPQRRAEIGQRSREAAAKRRAEREELIRLRAENAALREAITRLNGGDR